MKVLILGGYGVFGGRLAKLLSDLPQLELLIAGRSLERATEFCNDYQGSTKTVPLQLDRANISAALAKENPTLVVDASGPFQDYGSDGYHVIQTCIEHRIDYLDFADAADFVFGVSQFDNAAKDAGIFVLSGVSSFPVLTAAVLREIGKSMDIVQVDGGIAPSPYAGIGLNVMRAVVSYAGEPVKLFRGGKQTTAPGLAESTRFTVAVPGRLPLKNIHFSLVDVPDLQVIPPEHPGLQSIWMGAGPVPEILHRVLNVLAKARTKLPLPSLGKMSPLFYWVLNRMKFGEHRGGMYVRAKGLSDGKPTQISWHLLAEGDDGPYIPSMAIEAIVRKQLDGLRPDIGARPATRALELSDYNDLFESRSIHTGFRHEEDGPIYRQILGRALDELPDQIKAIHGTRDPRRWSGHAKITRGTGALAKIVARLIGFPDAGENVPVSVSFKPQGEAELWTRNFGGKVFSSLQVLGTGKNTHLLVEKFGIVSVALALVVEDEKLILIPRRWSCLGVPLPQTLLPKGETFEAQLDGQFQFNVEIAAPIAGLIVAYQGTLTPQSDGDAI